MSRSVPSSVSTKSCKRVHAGKQAHEIVLSTQREHRIDQIVPNAGLALLNLEAVGEEVEQLGGGPVEPMCVAGVVRLRRRDWQARRAMPGRASDASRLRDDQLDRRDRGAAKRERVLRAGRLLVDREEGADVSSLSASATATVTGAVGTSSPCPTGL